MRVTILLLVAACGGCGAAVPGAPAPTPADRQAVQAWLTSGSEASWCQRQLGLDALPADCMIDETALGQAVVVRVTMSCGDEYCALIRYVVTGADGPRRLPDDVELGYTVITPDRRWAFGGSAAPSGPDEYRAQLYRVELATMHAEPVAACAAPALSPGGRWIVCRDVDGNVHRLPLTGGPLEPVHEIDLGGTDVYRDQQFGVRLSPVQFPTPTTMRIVTTTNEVDEVSTDAPWAE